MKIADIEVKLIDSCGSDLSVVNAARVSMDKESDWEYYTESGCSTGEVQGLKQSDVKLIKYLADNKHFSPFNHAFLSFRIKAPIFCARQLVKHKFLPWNEVSRRYVDDEPEFYFPDNLRDRTANVKQGSGGNHINSEQWLLSAEQINSAALGLYRVLLIDGVCPEQARMFLPQNMMVEWIWSGTLGAFLDMLVLRLDLHSQKETRDVAELIAKEVKRLFPESYKERIK